jgi:putative NADPH-quinone reductase
MDKSRILIIDGHPDAGAERLMHALARAYADGAREADHEVRLLQLAQLEFPFLATAQDFQHDAPPATIAAVQLDVAWADHVVLMFPLWLGTLPARLKGLLEQVLRPGFAFEQGARLPRKLLKGKSARIVVTMGMPALFFKLVYRSHGLKCIERNILAFCGFHPIRETVVGGVENMSVQKLGALFKRMARLGGEAR